MNLRQIQNLAQHQGYPAVSIFLPTHRTHPENKQDPIVLKNLIREASDRIQAEAGKRDAEEFIERLHRVADGLNLQDNLEGLAIFMSKDDEQVLRLPFALDARVQIDDTYAIRDLVSAYNRTPRYLTLVLSEKPTRLFTCSAGAFEEVINDDFPMEHAGPGGLGRLPGGPGVNPSAVRDAHRLEFVKAVDTALTTALKAFDLPVIVTGTEDFLADWKHHASNADKVIAMVPGSYDFMPAHELAMKVWPIAKEVFAQIRDDRIGLLGQAVGANQFASGLVQVWQAAAEDRVSMVVVEEGYRQAATLSDDGRLPALTENPAEEGTIDDLVDDVIQKVLASGGEVVFSEPGSLKEHDHVAAVLRY